MLKIGPIPASFCLFSSFFVTISIIKIEKSIDGVLGIWTWGRKMVGADKTMELWRPPKLCWHLKQNILDVRTHKVLLHHYIVMMTPQWIDQSEDTFLTYYFWTTGIKFGSGRITNCAKLMSKICNSNTTMNWSIRGYVSHLLLLDDWHQVWNWTHY